MAWVIVKDGAVVREFSRPTAFTYEGYQYPRNWIQNATNAEKSAMGLVEVTISGNQKDNDYYDNTLSDNKVFFGSVLNLWIPLTVVSLVNPTVLIPEIPNNESALLWKILTVVGFTTLT